MHAVGVLHRDVKPSNVLMEGRTPILIDFGLARVADDPKLTHTGWLLGTPGYLAPEILYGDDATAASDVHSWAATVAYAGTGRPPFGRGPSMAIMDRVRRGQHDLSGLPDDLRQVVAAALDPDPTRRPTLPELLGWLRPRTPRPRCRRRSRRRSTSTTPTPSRSRCAVAGAPTGDDRRLARRTEPPRTARRRYDDDPWADPGPEKVAGRAERSGARHAPGRRRRRRRRCRGGVPLAGDRLLLLVVWLLRSGSLAASATGDRRRLRGREVVRRGAATSSAAPWHAVRSIPGTLLLVLWSLGLAIAAALLCYAFATGELTLFVCGIVLAVSLWLGPGGSRVRGPCRGWSTRSRCEPAAGWPPRRRARGIGALGFLAAQNGPDWAPDDTAPLSQLDLDAARPFGG